MSPNVALASAYAVLLLTDSNLPTTAANISKLLTEAKVTPCATSSAVLEKVLAVSPATNFIGSIGSGAPAAEAAKPAAAAAKKEEPKKVEERKIFEQNMKIENKKTNLYFLSFSA